MINHSQAPAITPGGNPGSPVPELAPSTQRDAEHLASRYGFASLAALASSLPEGAEILDLGAGASPLGREVALLRPDVHWTNLDTSYDDPLMRDELMPGVPHNLSFVAGDAQQLGELFPASVFDRVFSFWLLPHLSLNDDTAAVAAAEQMFRAAKDGGEVFIGPIFNSPYHDGTPETAYGDARRTVKTQDMVTADFAREAVRQTRLPIVASPCRPVPSYCCYPVRKTQCLTYFRNTTNLLKWLIYDIFIMILLNKQSDSTPCHEIAKMPGTKMCGAC